jgi:hypothetical protein
MICDDCTKKDVCRLKEQCNILENDLAHSKIEDAITLEVKCKHREMKTNAGIWKAPPLPSMPKTYPTQPDGHKPMTIRYSDKSSGDFRDDVNRESQSEYFGK